MDEKRIQRGVREIYESMARRGATARPGLGIEGGRELAHRLGYPGDFLDSLDEGHLKLFAGCGFPFAGHSTHIPGPVLDLGCGAGLDALFAATRFDVDVVGVDLTLGLLKKADYYVRGPRESRVSFVNADLDALPLKSDMFSLATGNCVFNILPDKKRALTEVMRVLAPGGALIFCDLAATGPLPPELSDDPAAWAFSAAGALKPAEYIRLLRDCGFVETQAEELQDHGPLASFRFRGLRLA